jgi:tetratricopeptide (TPR) repeat protein
VRRGNETIRIAIQDETAAASEEDDAGGGPEQAFASRPPISEEHARARVAARRGEFQQAFPVFERLVREHPRSASIAGEYGSWLAADRKPRKALPFLQQAERLQPSPYGAFRLGIVLMRLGDKKGAERELRRAIARRPAMTAARIALGNLLRKKGDLEEAIEHLQRATASGSNQEKARALVALGTAQLGAGRRADAERSFESAILFAPARAGIRIGIAHAWLASDAKEDWARAVRVLARAADMAPDVAAVHSALGRAQEKMGDAAAARDSYEHALRIDPGYRYVRRRVLRLALEGRDFQRARREADHLLADDPDDPEHHFLAAVAAEGERRLDEARKGYRKAIEVAKGEYPEAYLSLCALERSAGDLGAARAACEQAIKLRSGYPAAWVDLAKVQEAAHRPHEVESAYREALRHDPHFAPALLGLGQFLVQSSRLEEAIQILSKGLEGGSPEARPARLTLAAAFAKSGRTADAISAYRTYLAADPRHVPAWHGLAVALEGNGRTGEARDALRKAIEVDPAHVPSLRALAELDLREGRGAEARREFEELLDVTPGDLSARAGLAEALALLGDRGACESRARALRAEAPSDPRVQRLNDHCGKDARRASRP